MKRSISSNLSSLSFRQSEPTTSVSLYNVINSPQSDDMGGGYDSQSVYSTLNRYDTATIGTNPTLKIFNDNNSTNANNELESTLEVILNENSSSNAATNTNNSNSKDKLIKLNASEFKKELLSLKQYYILSSAGKLIYSNKYDNNNSNDENDDENEFKKFEYVGIIQTLINSFELQESKLKSIVAGSTRFTILDQSPIILLAISSISETEQELLNQLDILYTFLLSTLGKPNIIKSFKNKQNFDLRKHLGRADINGLNYLCESMIMGDIGILVGALQSMRIKKTVRDKIKQILISEKSSKILYGLLVDSDGKLINVLRPKTHTLHTTDLQILFSIVFNQRHKNGSNEEEETEEDQELWLPICLPKFNPNGFLYTYVKFINNISIILVSPDRSCFFEMKEISTNLINKLYKHKIFNQLNTTIQQGLSIVDIPAPLVHHFVYKSKSHLQYIMPTNLNLKSELSIIIQKYYLKLHHCIDKNSKISLVYCNWNDGEQSISGLSWETPNYEIFLLTTCIVNKETLVKSAKNIVNWCKKYEERLFVCEGAVF